MAYTTIKKSSDYFNTKLYTGNGSTGHAITGVGFQPDWLWIKERSSTSSHFIYDAIRGVNVKLSSNTTDADSTVADSMTSFDSDGFTVGNNGATNENGQTVVAWNWLASNTTASNTDGSISSTVSANTTSGFSIVKWTGTEANATIGHGLGVAPSMIIIKNTEKATSWVVYHKSLGATKALYLESTGASSTTPVFFNNTEPTSSVFTVGTNDGANGNGQINIAYCFAEKQGFSKFGSYVGNGSINGTFIYTGFKPALVILKRTESAGTDWNLVDNKRAGYNPDNYFLAPNSSGAENSVNDIVDLLSNGFKLTSASGASNASGGSYIYMAFAAEPLVGDNPATAR